MIEAKELQELGLQAPRVATDADGLVHLNRLSGVSFHYNGSEQTMHFTAPDARRVTQRIDAGGLRLRSDVNEGEAAHIVPSAVLTYLVYATTDTGLREFFNLDGRRGAVSASLDGRISGRYGSLAQSGILSAASDGVYGSVRLDTTFERDDEERLVTYRAG